MIIGLTDRSAAFPTIGTLRKGAPKPETGNKPGADLKHFRFDSEDKSASDLFVEHYGNEPRAIRVFVPFKTTQENFEAWKEEWTASSLKHRCDGVNCVRWLTPEGRYSDKPKPCPGGCKQVGRLSVIIPELKRAAFVTVLTTSIHDILQLNANLLALEAARGDLRGIPMVLKRSPRKISTPNGNNGDRARREKWLITIEAQPQWVELQLIAQEREALPQVDRLALPEWDGEEDEDEAAGGQTAGAASEETIAAIEKLWPRFGVKRGASVEPLADYLHRKKGIPGPRQMTQEEAANLLSGLQERAVEAEPKQGAVHQGEPVVADQPAPPPSSAIQEIENLLVKLRDLGCAPDEINAKISRIAGGVYAIDEIAEDHLPKVKQMLGNYVALGDRAAAEMAKEFKK
jgi:recombination directionality factor gp3-like protein